MADVTGIDLIVLQLFRASAWESYSQVRGVAIEQPMKPKTNKIPKPRALVGMNGLGRDGQVDHHV